MQILNSLPFQTIISNHHLATTTTYTHVHRCTGARTCTHTGIHIGIGYIRWTDKDMCPSVFPTFLLPPSLHVNLEGNPSTTYIQALCTGFVQIFISKASTIRQIVLCNFIQLKEVNVYLWFLSIC